MKQEIKYWIEDFVSVYNEKLRQIPCPYARKALINDKIKYVGVKEHTIATNMETYANLWDDSCEVVVFYIEDEITVEHLSNITHDFNKQFMPKDFVALEDHPDDPEVMNGVTMNFGKAPLVLLQRLSALNSASEQLKQRGYYADWPEENYKDVVEWRFK